MNKIKLFVLTLSIAFVLAGCAENPSATKKTPGKESPTMTSEETAQKNQGGKHGSNEGKPSQTEETAHPMRDCFLPDGAKANYYGEGNEFAGFKVEVAQPYENIFVIYENNGGVFVRRTYEVHPEKINILEETTVDYKDEYPSLEEIQAMKPIGIYLQKPISEGTMFDDWTIVETGLTLETPYQTFDDVFVIEMNTKDAINRKYFAQGFGEIKRESIMSTEEDENFIVTSTLESVDK